MKYIKKICMEQKRGKAEIIALLCYMIGVCIIGYFHEPWFDEAQAWQIARSASLKEILFEIPHYEGHPQLWHLVLMPFAKLNAPYELTLFAVNFFFCLLSVALILFKSPFPKIVRCLVPFTYFFFYQFGVISRPYSMMMLAFMLSAMTYFNRNTKPVPYISALCFLCATSAYGILFAGGLCIVWVIEIFLEYKNSQLWSKLVSDRRCHALLGILIFAILLILSIVPAEDCYYGGSDLTILERLKLLPYVFIFPFDSVIGCYLNEEVITTGGLIAECIGGVLFWFLLLEIMYANKKILLFLVPYGLFMIFSVSVYFSVHHLGVSMLFIVFIFWIMAEQGMKMPMLFMKLNQKVVTKSIRVLAGFVGILAVCTPLLCTAISSINDIFHCYGPKAIADFIKENNLDNRKIMSFWGYTFDIPEEEREGSINTIIWDETLPAKLLPIDKHYPNLCGTATAILPYFNENIFINFNTDDKEKLYMRWLDNTNYQQTYDLWQAQGLPEIIIGLVPLQEIYSQEQLQDVTYYWVETLKYGKIWKQYKSEGEVKIYIREDILADYPQFEIQKY